MAFFNLKFINRIFTRSDHVVGYHNPYLDWFRISCVFTTLLTLVFVVCAVLFVKIDQGKIFKPAETTARRLPVLDEAALKKTGDYYRALDQALEALKTKKTESVDPAL